MSPETTMQALTKHILRISIGLGTVLALFGAESAAAAQALGAQRSE